MYLDSIKLENLRTFVSTTVDLVHPETDFTRVDKAGGLLLPQPRLPNVNLLLGDNGSGKTTLLRAVALAGFGPAVSDVKVQENYLVRNLPGQSSRPPRAEKERWPEASIRASFLLHEQDGPPGKKIESAVTVVRRGELEGLHFRGESSPAWERIFESKNDAFFMVGYGATRRVERGESFDMGARTKSRFLRAQRVQGVFEDSFSLIPLTYWLPKLKTENPGRYKQVVNLINRLLGPGHYRFTGETDRGDYLFEKGRMRVPFLSMSDGYRAFLGWVADLLYHICYGCPSGKKLVENAGIVMVDEIDLHLHPRWQMDVIATIAKALPRMQFIFTSHSPLVAGSLEWMNIIALKASPKLITSAQRLRQRIHGLDADQVLLTDFFGLSSTRAAAKEDRLNALTLKARQGDEEAAKEIVLEMSRGMEAAR